MRTFPGKMLRLIITAVLTAPVVSHEARADECGTRPFCGSSWPTQGCYPIPIICGGVPDPGPIIPAPLPPPTTTPPGPGPAPSPRPPPYTLVNPYPISDSDAAAWGLSMTPGTDPDTLQPTRRYATASGRTLPKATREALARGIENHLNRLHPHWFCDHFSNVATDATQSVIDCTQVDDTPAPTPHLIRISGFGYGDGNYPAPETHERYNVADIYDALRTGREMNDPVYQSAGPAAIFAIPFVAGSIALGPKIMAMSSGGIKLMAALADTGLAAAGADGATGGSVSAAVAGEWISLRGLREPQAGRVMAHLDRLGARLFPGAGNLNNLARELAYAGDGPMAALVERGDPGLSRYLTHYAHKIRYLSLQEIRSSPEVAITARRVMLGQAHHGLRSAEYRSLVEDAIRRHGQSMLRSLEEAFFEKNNLMPTHFRALPTQIVSVTDAHGRPATALRIVFEIGARIDDVLRIMQCQQDIIIGGRLH